MEFVYRAIPHPVRRLFNKNKEGSGLEDSYRLRRMESHASISATKRRRIYLNLTPESVETDFDAPSEPPSYPTNKVTTSVNAMPLTIFLYPLTHVSPGQDSVAGGPGLVAQSLMTYASSCTAAVEGYKGPAVCSLSAS